MIKLGPSRALKIVAWLLIFEGVSSVANAVAARSVNPTHSFDFNVFGLILGVGLLRRRAWALKWSELWVVLSIFIAAPVLVMTTVYPPDSPATVSFAGHSIAMISQYVTATILAVFIALSVWEYRVLIRDDVRALALGR